MSTHDQKIKEGSYILFRKYKHAALNIGGLVIVQLIYAGLLFLTGLMLARHLGITEFGAYDYAEGWLEVVLAVSIFGFDRLLISQIALYTSQKNWSAIQGILSFSRRTIFGISILSALLIAAAILGLFFLNTNEETHSLRLPLLVVAAILPIRTFIRHNQATLHGLQYVVWAHIPDFIIRPGILLLVIVSSIILAGWQLSAFTAMLIHLAATLLALGASYWILRKIASPMSFQAIPDTTLSKQWFIQAIPFMILTATTILSVRLATIMLGYLANFDVVAQYGVLFRFATLINLFPLAIYKLIAPKLSISYASGNREALRKSIFQASFLSGLVALMIGIIIILFGHFLLSIFGPEYTDSLDALIIMCLSFILLAPFGVFIWLLMMTGYQWGAATSLIIATISSVFLYLLLIPPYGLIGAVIATGVTAFIRTISAIYFTRRFRIIT